MADKVFMRCEALNIRWRREMLEIRSDSAEEQAVLDLRRLFKGYIKYEKAPGMPNV